MVYKPYGTDTLFPSSNNLSNCFLALRTLKMFARVPAAFLCIVFYLSVLAVATPWGVTPTPTVTVTVTAPAPTVTTVSQCNTGPEQCCDQVISVGLIYD